MTRTINLITLALALGLGATSATAHGPFPRPWQIQPFATMLECQAGTEPDAIAPYCEELLDKFASELQACKTAQASTAADGGPADDAVCNGQAAATAAAQVSY